MEAPPTIASELDFRNVRRLTWDIPICRLVFGYSADSYHDQSQPARFLFSDMETETPCGLNKLGKMDQLVHIVLTFQHNQSREITQSSSQR